MSMSAPGPDRVPSTVRVGKKSGQGKPPAHKSGTAKSAPGKAGGAKSGPAKKATAGKGPQGRKPVTPVKVNGGRNWGPILVVAAVIVVAAGIIGYGVFAVAKDKNEKSTPWDKRVSAISG